MKTLRALVATGVAPFAPPGPGNHQAWSDRCAHRPLAGGQQSGTVPWPISGVNEKAASTAARLNSSPWTTAMSWPAARRMPGSSCRKRGAGLFGPFGTANVTAIKP